MTCSVLRDNHHHRACHCAFSFFFQAEDGIRDWSVTGVQTCALPIYNDGPESPRAKYSYWRMEDLFLHEAIPGHHYERSLSTENPNLPGNQKIGGYGA